MNLLQNKKLNTAAIHNFIKIIKTSCSILNDLSSEISQTDDISVAKINKNGPYNRKLKKIKDDLIAF